MEGTLNFVSVVDDRQLNYARRLSITNAPCIYNHREIITFFDRETKTHLHYNDDKKCNCTIWYRDRNIVRLNRSRLSHLAVVRNSLMSTIVSHTKTNIYNSICHHLTLHIRVIPIAVITKKMLFMDDDDHQLAPLSVPTDNNYISEQ
jgi:hypothetical protein